MHICMKFHRPQRLFHDHHHPSRKVNRSPRIGTAETRQKMEKQKPRVNDDDTNNNKTPKKKQLLPQFILFMIFTIRPLQSIHTMFGHMYYLFISIFSHFLCVVHLFEQRNGQMFLFQINEFEFPFEQCKKTKEKKKKT